MVQAESGQIIRRLALTLVGGRIGTGSYNYLLNLVRAIDTYGADRLRPVLFVGTDVADEDVAPFREHRAVDVVQSPAFDAHHDTARLCRAVMTGRDPAAASSFSECGIDVAFEPAMFFGWRFPIPAIAWLPDFQHRHLRHLFSTGAYWHRELGFRAQIASGRLIMLSSEDARGDCERFYPRTHGRTSVVRFAVRVDAALLGPDPMQVAREYALPEHFFYMPNQFWKHKNHGVVVDALSALKQRGRNVVVATSGKVGDPRYPRYFDELRALVAARGLTEQFRFLGLVPRPHVIALMRASTAIINPSLFEGWSTPVEEARTLGVPMLLSTLAVHREQMGDAARYFEPDSATQLAELMELQPELPVESRRAVERAALEASGERVRKFCLDFLETVERVLAPRGEVDR